MKTLILFLAIFSISLQAKVVSIMNYNAENLFDTVHDKGKEDYTYLPLRVKKKSKKIQQYCNSLPKKSWRKSCLNTDWSEQLLDKKLTNIAKVLKAHSKKGADIIVLQEVENYNVVNMLVKKKLKGMGYKYIALVEGLDKRGIDNAVISRYPISSQKMHNFSLAPYSNRPTRGILEVNVKVGKSTLKLFVNHWPSQGSPSGARFIASEELAKIAKKSRATLTLALGDFNTLTTDVPHGINSNILPLFHDAHTEALNLGVHVREGSHWYKGHWSRLDRIFVLKKSKSKAKVLYKSFSIFSKPFMLRDLDWEDYETGEITHYRDIPFRFSSRSGDGFSDHLPLAIKVDL